MKGNRWLHDCVKEADIGRTLRIGKVELLVASLNWKHKISPSPTWLCCTWLLVALSMPQMFCELSNEAPRMRTRSVGSEMKPLGMAGIWDSIMQWIHACHEAAKCHGVLLKASRAIAREKRQPFRQYVNINPWIQTPPQHQGQQPAPAGQRSWILRPWKRSCWTPTKTPRFGQRWTCDLAQVNSRDVY